MCRFFSLAALLFVSTVVCADDPVATAPTEAVNIAKETANVDSWRLEQHEEGKGQMEVQDGGILFTVEVPGTENWHVQAVQTDLDLEDGETYTVKFKASSPNNHLVSISAGVDQDDFHAIGLNEEFYAEAELKDYEYTFTASETVEGKNRLSFVLSTGKGSVLVKDLTLVPAE
jgi:hypothetical protein